MGTVECLGGAIGYLGIWVLDWFRYNAFGFTSRAVAWSALAFLAVRYGKMETFNGRISRLTAYELHGTVVLK